MKLELLGNGTKAEKDERRAMIRSASPTLRLYREVLQSRLDKALLDTLSKVAYETPNWAYLQADAVGYARAYKEIIELLTLDQEEH